MAKFKRRTKGRTKQSPNLNEEGQRDEHTMTKFKRRRTKGRTTQRPNLNEEGQRDEQHNDQI
jgi:hypothetical protein